MNGELLSVAVLNPHADVELLSPVCQRDRSGRSEGTSQSVARRAISRPRSVSWNCNSSTTAASSVAIVASSSASFSGISRLSGSKPNARTAVRTLYMRSVRNTTGAVCEVVASARNCDHPSRELRKTGQPFLHDMVFQFCVAQRVQIECGMQHADDSAVVFTAIQAQQGSQAAVIIEAQHD